MTKHFQRFALFSVLAVAWSLRVGLAAAAIEGSASLPAVYAKEDLSSQLRFVYFLQNAEMGSRVWIENQGAVKITRYTLQGVRIGPDGSVLGKFSRTVRVSIPPHGFLVTTVPELNSKAHGTTVFLAIAANGNSRDHLSDFLLPTNPEQARDYRPLNGALELGPIDELGCCSSCQLETFECGNNLRSNGSCASSRCLSYYTCTYQIAWHEGLEYCNNVSCSYGCKESSVCCY